MCVCLCVCGDQQKWKADEDADDDDDDDNRGEIGRSNPPAPTPPTNFNTFLDKMKVHSRILLRYILPQDLGLISRYIFRTRLLQRYEFHVDKCNVMWDFVDRK